MTKGFYKKLCSELDFKYCGLTLFKHILTEAAIIFCAIGLFSLSGPFAFAASIPIAVVMIRNVSFMHEAVHGLAHPNSTINYLFGLLAGSLCLLPFHLWKKIHLEHHFWAGNFNKDPSLEIMKRYPQISSAQKSLLNFSWKTRMPLTAFFQYIVFWAHSAVGLMKNHREGLLWMNMISPLTIWVLILWNLHGQQFAIIGAGFFLYLMLFEAINFPHHVGLYLEDSQTARLQVWEQYAVTRTSRYPRLIEKVLVLNFNYHAEHHVFPNLPWHQLPMAHAIIQKSQVQSETTVIRWGWLGQRRKSPFMAFLRPDVYEIEKEISRVS